MKSEKLKIAGGFILICLIWGSTWLAIRIGLYSLTPIFAAGIRFSLAAILIYALIKLGKIPFPTDSASMKIYFFLGFFAFLVPYGLVYWAEQFIPSSLTSILFAVLPFGVIIFSRFFHIDVKISMYQLFGVILGFIGIFIIFFEDLKIEFSDYFLGMLAVLLSALIQSIVSVYMKKNVKNLNPLSLNFIPLVISGILMLIAGFLFEDNSKWIFDFRAIGSFVYLAVFGTVVAFTTYYWMLKRVNVVILSLNTFITPIVAVILGWVILNEKLSVWALGGSGLVLIGILFANFSQLKNFIVKRQREIPLNG